MNDGNVDNGSQEAEADEVRSNMTMMEFVEHHTLSDSIAEVVERTGLNAATVQAKASKYRQTEYEMEQKLNGEGEPLFRTEAGGETTDKAEAKHTKATEKVAAKAIKVLVRKLEDGKPVVKREAINLQKFERGGGTRLQAGDANELIAKLLAKKAEDKAAKETATV